MVGLQGAGKTTTTGKLAKYIRDTYKKKPLLVAADVYRPAAVDQLRVLGEQLDMPVFYDAEGDPPDICERAVEEAKKTGEGKDEKNGEQKKSEEPPATVAL